MKIQNKTKSPSIIIVVANTSNGIASGRKIKKKNVKKCVSSQMV